MRKRILMFTLTSMLMFLCIPTSAQEIVVGHIDDADSIFFNSANYDGLGITSLDDIIDKLPGAERQDDGSITVNGKHITRILINGKQWFPEHEYVDLGLSVKWATCNVGASKPYEYGEYYSWGETETKESYEPGNYTYANGGSAVNDKNTLDIENDVAHKKWGGKWRMPSREEFDELIQNCTWTWTTQNDVNGFLVTSNKPGYTDRSIFLPAAGLRSLSELRLSGDIGFYWTTTPSEHFAESACFLYITPGFKSLYESAARNQAHSVRPVCP